MISNYNKRTLERRRLMDPLFLILIISFFLPPSIHALNLASRITVVGAVFCDVCYNDTFSSHRFFLPGADVNVECKFKENWRGRREQTNVSENKSRDRFRVYRIEITNADGDGVECIRWRSLCRATLLESSRHHSFCNIRGMSTTWSDTFKSTQNNKNHHCIYTLSPLSYRGVKKNTSLCASNDKIYNSSKFFLLPPYPFFWPPQLPPLPHLPNLPFPFPPTPPLFSPPVFDLGDPRGWFPNLPSPPLVPPPPPPSSFDLGNPRTWIPFNPPTPPPS